ncbi:arad-like aldolase/epimerase [Schizopora paradoxa]|uniref:Arad-like aldolase/epimerase n=1 Tax=Schizopora paradoxa TaxID=27342 RepID=A0A0H2S4H2_9AGAM|nr:arad-like aldolase/epimerase [Schizopora paradoxa]
MAPVPTSTSTLSSPSSESVNVIETLKANLRRKTFKSTAAIAAVPLFADKYEEREFLKFRLAQAFRIFGKLGYDEGAAGHITVTDPIKTNCFWLNPLGLHFSLVQPSDLILVDFDGNIMEESGHFHEGVLNVPAFYLHSAIHKARPGMLCAAHCHSLYGRAFSALGCELDMITQDTCVFYNDHTIYKNFNGTVKDVEEGIRIAECLGNRKAAILENHGLLVAADSIEAAVYYFMGLEKACQVQLLADAAAIGRGHPTVKISEAECIDTYEVVGHSKGGWFNGLPQFQLLEVQEGVRFEYKRD